MCVKGKILDNVKASLLFCYQLKYVNTAALLILPYELSPLFNKKKTTYKQISS